MKPSDPAEYHTPRWQSTTCFRDAQAKARPGRVATVAGAIANWIRVQVRLAADGASIAATASGWVLRASLCQPASRTWRSPTEPGQKFGQRVWSRRLSLWTTMTGRLAGR
uniref:Uncharacterized protein n=1 Tax=Streptomyces violaceoruber TaxID=1935 RepID=Q849E4_STRVN|nr:hypothetical protein [Streptomyces violaceoruber]